MNVLSKGWVPLVVVVAVVLGGVTVDRLRNAFGSEAIFSTSGRNARPLVLVAPHLPRQANPGDRPIHRASRPRVAHGVMNRDLYP